MKTHHIMFIIAGLLAVVWFVQIGEISALEAEAAVLRARIDHHNNPLSGDSFVSYGKALFDGFTLGVFSGGDIFAEAKKVEATSDSLKREGVNLLARHSKATTWRNVAFLGCIIFGVIGYFSTPGENKHVRS